MLRKILSEVALGFSPAEIHVRPFVGGNRLCIKLNFSGPSCAVAQPFINHCRSLMQQQLPEVIMFTNMQRVNFRRLWVALAVCGITTSMLMPSVANAEADPMVQKSMATLKAATARLGAPKVEGMEAVSGKNASALYFGTTKTNNNFDVVDAVVKEHGGTATLFAKTGDEYVRVSRAARIEIQIDCWL